MENKKKIISDCRVLLKAYKAGKLGDTTMPEDCHPIFNNVEEKLVYFTLPMALNYQRDSYKLWQTALLTFNDPSTRNVFNIHEAGAMEESEMRVKLTKHKLALQPNKHVHTWHILAQTLGRQWGSLGQFFESNNNDFLTLRNTVQKSYKQGFPYLSGPKIFNYWSFIISTYGEVELRNKDFIEIAPDTHITKCSVVLGVISEKEAEKLSKDQISARWRELLHGSGIMPIEMHSPLWFWSRNGFEYKLDI